MFGLLGVVSSNASPGSHLFLTSPEEFCDVCRGFVAGIYDLVGMTKLERWNILKNFSMVPEYRIVGFLADF